MIKPLDPNVMEIYKLFNNIIYNVPVYQRPYSWDTNNVKTLLTDIWDIYTSNHKEDGYYTGNLLLHDNSEKVNGTVIVYDVIDGQQRITTFALLLLAMFCTVSAREDCNDDDTYRDLKKLLWKTVNGRKPEKEYRVVRLNSIEKGCFERLFTYAFDYPQKTYEYALQQNSSLKSEKNVIENFITICNQLDEKFPKEDGVNALLNYAKYVTENVRFIAIACHSPMKNVFSMFESINSKGKKLEEIDLIKSLIFSTLEEDVYNDYLDRWGQLIIKTDDNLYDYFYTYIKAFIKFYKQNITIDYFKGMDDRLLEFYGVTTIGDAYKALIDDMLLKVDSFTMLSSQEEAAKLFNGNKKFRFYYRVFTKGSYTHPKPLFMRIFDEYKKNRISKDDAIEIVEHVVKYVIKFSNIAALDSKDTIPLFSNIMKNVYAENRINKEYILSLIGNETALKGLDDNRLRMYLESMDAYVKNKNATVALLALYESLTVKDGVPTISYDKAYTLVEMFGKAFHLDHLLPRTPAIDNDDYRYYIEGTNDNEVLRLKDGSDFPDNVKDGMLYSSFQQLILNKIGNLRLYYGDRNAARQNDTIEFRNYGVFHTYADIQKREDEMLPSIIEYILAAPPVNNEAISEGSKSTETKLPRMRELIEAGYLSVGDELVVEDTIDESAILLSPQNVSYKGTRMSLNEWVAKVKNWSSANVYLHVRRKDEDETLQEKRKRLYRES